MDYKRYDFELKLVLIREYWFVILRLLDDYLLNLWSSGSIQIYIPYTLIIILFARWKYYICNKCYEIIRAIKCISIIIRIELYEIIW